MSNFTTTWKLNFVAEVKKFIKDTKDITHGVGAVEGKIKRTGKQIKESISAAKTDFDRLKQEVRENEKELKELEKAAKNALPGLRRSNANKALNEHREKVKALKDALLDAGDAVELLNDEFDGLQRSKKGWAEIATGLNQTHELLTKLSSSFDFAVKIRNLNTQVQRMTDLSGSALDSFVMKSREIADVYDQNAEDVARTVNVMTKQLGGSYETNFALLESGFKRGADLSGSLVSSMEKHSGTIASLGLSGEQAMALMAKAAKDGFSPDDAIDSIKNAGNALTEMGIKQEKALAGIGLKTKDLAGKTAFEAIQTVSQAMEGMSTQAKQQVLARVFSTAGKDSGMAFIEGLSSGIPNLEDLPEVQEAGSGFKSFFSNISTWAGQAFGGFATYAQQMSPILTTTVSATQLLQGLTKVTWLQNYATKALAISQKILNLVMGNSPLGWVVRILGLLVTGVMLAWDKFEGFRKAMFRVGAWAKNFGSIIKEYLIDRVKGLISGISGLGKAIGLLFSRKWKEAAAAGKQAVNDLVGFDAAGKAIAKATDEKRNQAVTDEADKRHAAYEEGRKKEKEQEEGINGLVAPKQAEVLSFTPDDKTKKGKGEKDGLNVGSGSGGLRSIAMTLNITNNFSVSKDSNIRDIADKIVGMVNDRMRDSVINMGV